MTALAANSQSINTGGFGRGSGVSPVGVRGESPVAPQARMQATC